VGRPVARFDRAAGPGQTRRVKPKRDRDDYSTGSFKAGIVMILAILAAIVLIWLAYSWALNQPGAPRP
jgi:hypothetical protein